MWSGFSTPIQVNFGIFQRKSEFFIFCEFIYEFFFILIRICDLRTASRRRIRNHLLHKLRAKRAFNRSFLGLPKSTHFQSEPFRRRVKNPPGKRRPNPVHPEPQFFTLFPVLFQPALFRTEHKLRLHGYPRNQENCLLRNRA
jgi:hypothetical protein